MTAAAQTAHRFREVILNGVWVANTNFKDQLDAVSWGEATQRIGQLNTIALLTRHLHYYIAGILNVLEGGTLDIHDRYSFDFPPVSSPEEWEGIKEQLWRDAERFAALVEQLPDEQLQADFADKNYGSYQRTLDAMIEHSYYHLGQVVLIRKLLADAHPGE